MNTLCGVGLLSSVYVVKQGGWLSLTILLTFTMLAFYTCILLRRCVDSKPGIETYPDIGQAAFGAKGKLLISICLYMELYVSCVEYIILENDTLSSLFPNAYLNIVGLRFYSNVIFVIVAVSGSIDYVTDGHRVVGVHNGVPMMQKITATGCVVTALIAAFVSMDPSNPFEATACALSIFGLAVEVGMSLAMGPAYLRMHMINSLHGLDAETLISRVRIASLC